VIGLIASGAMLGIYVFFAVLIASIQEGIQGFIGEVMFVGFFVILLAVILGTIMITIRMQRQIMLANALNIRFSSMSWLRDYAISVCNNLNIPPMEIFIIQQPMLNAYAFGFMKPYCVVLHSGAVDGLTPDELKSIVVHEIGHIAYRHTNIGIYLAPLYSIPFFGGIFHLDFWFLESSC
jgi:Zn-dependent protease with chaperone function